MKVNLTRAIDFYTGICVTFAFLAFVGEIGELSL